MMTPAATPMESTGEVEAMIQRFCVALIVVAVCLSGFLSAQDKPETPRIDSVQMLLKQPQERDPAVIWYDDFDDDATQDQYAEKRGETTAEVHFGDRGKSLRMHYPKGSRGIGGRKLFFGDSPVYPRQAVRRGESFADVYWRIYVKHQHGWTGGGPAKLSRATSMVSSNWRQAMIAHVWGSSEALTLDPASGVRGNLVVTRRYNDFNNLKWLGNRPGSQFKLHSTEESGRWVCVEARAKLNTPGKKDGLNQLWIDGRLEAERRGLDWRGTYTGHGINAVFLEAYWNKGSPVAQSRWIDNFVVSTGPVGPVVCPRNPTAIKTPYRGPGTQRAWQIEIATAEPDSRIVWRSNKLESDALVAVSDTTGQFLSDTTNGKQLAASQIHFVRVRQQSSSKSWSEWSPWHQPFRTAE